MPRPTCQAELLVAMSHEYERLMGEIDEMDRSDREASGVCETWSVKDILAHLDAWHEMFLRWERAGAAGETIEMPAPGFTWKDTPHLNEQIYVQTKGDGYAEVTTRLADSHDRVRLIVSGYSDDDLSTKRRFKWTGSTSVLSYAVSATSSHYDWARKLIRKFKKTL